MDTKLASLIDRLEQVVQRAESASGASGQAPAQAGLAGSGSPLVKAWVSDVVSKTKALIDSSAALNN